ncbi:MAG: hypothetical protein IJC91_03360 [Oscillospiraceae bacterium]|nr:hypothetical protein [Oscillospiraceae bacterium]
MADVKMECAKKVYETICGAIEARGWKYEKIDDELLVHFNVSGDDLPVQYLIFVDAERQLIRLLSPMPFDMVEEKRVDGAIATTFATYGLTDGSFDYDVSNGKIVYRMTAAFLDNEVSPALVHYMIDFTGVVVDKYNDKFFAINKGFLSIEDFISK